MSPGATPTPRRSSGTYPSPASIASQDVPCWGLPAIAIVLFWIYRQATPGKIAIAARIVDAETGGKPSTRQLVIRYLGYYVSMLPLLAGIVWVAFDPRKQGWHDKLAGTVVVRPRRRGPARVDFRKPRTP